MDDVPLLLYGLMKVTLIVAVMVLVVTAPASAEASSHQRQTGLALTTTRDQDDNPKRGRPMLHADDGLWLEANDTSPLMNLDGTPMSGDIDINGNFYDDSGGSSMWDD